MITKRRPTGAMYNTIAVSLTVQRLSIRHDLGSKLYAVFHRGDAAHQLILLSRHLTRTTYKENKNE